MNEDHSNRPRRKMSNTSKGLFWAGGIIGSITLIVLMMPGLLYAAVFWCLSVFNLVVGEDNIPYNARQRNGVAESVTKFTPNPSWTQVSATEVTTPKRCGDNDRNPTAADCEMYRGVWNTNAPYAPGSIDTIAERFGGFGPYGKPYTGKPECVRPTPLSPLENCEAVTFVSAPHSSSFAFKVTVTDQGPGTDATVTVHYTKAQRGYY